MINRWLPALSLMVLLLSGCDKFKAWYAREFKQGDVSSGIARLSAQHVSMITSELGKKFKDAKVPTTIVRAQEPQEYGKGSVTKTIEDLDIAYPDDQVIYEDCLGNKALWSGKVHVIKATQTIYGRLTNNPENPVIPDPDRVKMTIHVAPKNVRIKFSNKDAFIELHNGEISFDAYPRLAQAQSGSLKGLRIIPTSNSRFENVAFKDVTGTLFSEQVTMPFNVSDSNYVIQIGAGENGEENRLEGEITAFGYTRAIPVDGNALVPDYDAAEFMKTYSCKEELAGVVSYKGVLLEEKMGPGMAALTTLAMSKIASKFADDYDCGMSSPAYLKTTTIQGNDGENGQASASLSNPCPIRFNHYMTEPDCMGIAYEINGEAIITAAKKVTSGMVMYTLTGFLSLVQNYENLLLANDIAGAMAIKPEPIIPVTRQPAEIFVTADISQITIKEVCLSQGSLNHAGHCSVNKQYQSVEFDMASGRVTATLKPMMAKGIDPADDRVLDICAVRNIPVAEAELVINGLNASIKKSGNMLQMRAEGVYRAVSGRIGNRENELSGGVTIGNVVVPFRDNDVSHIPLKPDYDRKLFIDSFQSCKQTKFFVPESDDDCQI
jgi:hypothetical protein